MISGLPSEPVDLPEAVAARSASGARPVWLNMLGGLTFEVDGPERRFIKWVPVSSGLRLGPEADRLSWAAAFTAVPRVLEHGADEEGEWLVLTALPGENAVARRWKADPPTAVAAIGRGLRELHEQLPVGECPYSWSVDERLADARRRARQGDVDPGCWHDVHHSLSVDAALELAARPAPVDRLVVCHGDACAPNTLLADDGSCSGHVDFGSMGVADRWADLAVATWSTSWNYGPGWETLLLDAYGVAPDPERTRYYRLLWDLGP